jgi:hypothetical protein
MRRERGERQRQKAEVNINVKMSGRRRDRTGFCMEFSCTVSTSAPLARIKFFSLSLLSPLTASRGQPAQGFLTFEQKDTCSDWESNPRSAQQKQIHTK